MEAAFQLGRQTALDLDGPEATVRPSQQQIDLRPAAAAVEIGLNHRIGRHGVGEQILDGKSFPTGAHHRVGQQRFLVGNVEQGMRDAAVADEDLGRLHQPFAEIGMPGRQAAHQQQIDQQKARVIADLESRNLSFFTQETEKLDAWADDLKVGLEREIKELDRNIKEARTKSKGAATLADKLQAQKEQRDLEAQRDKKRRELFNRQDEIQGRRDQLIEELEAQLGQQLSQRTLFSCEWEVL